MNYVLEEEKILNEWWDEFKRNSNNPKIFAFDGILFRGKLVKDSSGYWIHEHDIERTNKTWTEAGKRILYLTKDQNLGGEEEAWDDRKLSFKKKNSDKDNTDNRGEPFYRRILWTLYGLAMTTPEKKMEFDSFTNEEALNLSEQYPFAKINCRKEGGTSKCENYILEAAMNEYALFLEKQILNLDADIFVCCGSQLNRNVMIEFLNKHGYNFNCVSYAIWYDENKNKIAIDAYHPSYRKVTDENYYEEVVDSYFKFLKEHPQFNAPHR